jgi:hypothetical protein
MHGAIPLAPTLAGVILAMLATNVGRALFVPPMVAWLGDLFLAAQRSQANAAFSLVSGVAAILVLAGLHYPPHHIPGATS